MSGEQSGFVVLEGHGDAAHPELAHWHGNIGDPVALDLAAPLEDEPEFIDVLSWNVAIGLGRVAEVVTKIRAGYFDGVKRSSDRPLVILAQEAFRADHTIPETLQSEHHGGHAPRNARIDIVEVADALSMSLRYAPSMRNGHHRSDRGNAVLASVALTHGRAFPLSHVRQRRVAVAAELTGLEWLTFASAHLDTRGRVRDTRMTGRYASGRSAQAHSLGRRLSTDWPAHQTVLIGADLNSYFALREPSLKNLRDAGFVRVPHVPRRTHTFHAAPVKMLLDHILLRAGTRTIKSVHVMRLDENSRDRGPRVFGSDHHPLLASIRI